MCEPPRLGDWERFALFLVHGSGEGGMIIMQGLVSERIEVA